MVDLSLIETFAGLATVAIGLWFVLWWLHLLIAPRLPAPLASGYAPGTQAAFRWIVWQMLGGCTVVLFDVPTPGCIEITVVVPAWRAPTLLWHEVRLVSALRAECPVGIELRYRGVHAWRMRPWRERAHA